jgi:hypothetical protein
MKPIANHASGRSSQSAGFGGVAMCLSAHQQRDETNPLIDSQLAIFKGEF